MADPAEPEPPSIEWVRLPGQAPPAPGVEPPAESPSRAPFAHHVHGPATTEARLQRARLDRMGLVAVLLAAAVVALVGAVAALGWLLLV